MVARMVRQVRGAAISLLKQPGFAQNYWMQTGEDSRAKVVAALLAAVSLMLYLPVCRFGFVGFDDGDYISGNLMVRAGWTWQGLQWALWEWHAANWHPLTWISHMSDCQFFGLDAGKHHLVNAVLHAANSALVFLVLRSITQCFWRSAIVAALFAFHPLRVESVAWISERKDVLSGFFFLLALYTYGRYVIAVKAGEALGRAMYVLTLLLFAAGLMSKPMVVTLPFVLLLIDFWPLSRLAVSKEASLPSLIRGLIKKENRTLLIEKMPFFVLSALSCALTVWAQKTDSVVSLENIPVAPRIENALIGWATYIGRIVWPQDLCFLYLSDWSFSWGVCLFAGGCLAAICIVVIRAWQSCPWLVTGWFWFIGMLIPVIGLVQVGNQATADRYTYLPSIGFSVALTWGFWELSKRLAVRREVLIALTGIVLLTAAVLTRYQLEFWRDTQALMNQALKVNPANHIALNNSGYDFYLNGKYEEAEERLRRAVQAKPSYLAGWNNLAMALCRQGKFDECFASFRTALSICPGDARTLAGYGSALLEAGRTNEAEAVLREAVARNSELASVRLSYAKLLDCTGRQTNAIPIYQQILQKEPNNDFVHHLLASDLSACGRTQEALMHYVLALNSNPGSAAVHADFAAALDRANRPADALAEWQEALRLEPTNLSALKGLAWFRAMTRHDPFRRPAEAVLLAMKACQATGNTNTFCLGLLDTAYAEDGRFEDAIAIATQVRELARSSNDGDVARLAELRIKAYREKRSLRPKQP